jgi:hypothetical protein
MKAEVGHGARRSSYIQGVTRGDQDYFEQVALGIREHETIVERRLHSELQNGAFKRTGFCKMVRSNAPVFEK